MRSTKIMVLQYKNHARNGAFGLAGGLIPPRLGWRAAEVKRAQLLMTARFREDGSGPDSLHVSIGEIEQLGELLGAVSSLVALSKTPSLATPGGKVSPACKVTL